MAEQHRATAGEWASIRARADDMVTYSTILELLHRVEALEAKDEDSKEAWAAMRRAGNSHGERIGALMERIEDLENDRRAILNSSSRLRLGLEATQPAQPKSDSSLVERVAFALTGDSDGPINWKPEARAAIRAVAAWLREEKPHMAGNCSYFAGSLDQEAKRHC